MNERVKPYMAARDRLIKPGRAAKGFLPRPWKLLVKVFYENLSQEPSISVASLTRDLIIFLILGKTDLETPGRINTFPVKIEIVDWHAARPSKKGSFLFPYSWGSA